MADRHDHLQEAGASSSSSASSKPEQQHSSSNTTRDRNASSSVDSGFSLSTLEESLPSLSQSNGDDPQDNATGYEHEQRDADGQASQLKEDENNTADAAEERQIDEHHKALRRYSSEIAAHTAHMFESCYGGTIREGPNGRSTPSTESEEGKNAPQ